MKKIIVVLISCIMVLTACSQEIIYGNDEAGILNLLESIDIIVDEIEIIDIVDIGDYRIVGFSEGDGKLGSMKLTKNKQGNYETTHTEVIWNKTAMSFFHKTRNVEGIYGVEAVIVQSQEVKKIELVVNEKVKEIREVDKYPCMIIMPLEDTGSSMSVNINFYDINENKIN